MEINRIDACNPDPTVIWYRILLVIIVRSCSVIPSLLCARPCRSDCSLSGNLVNTQIDAHLILPLDHFLLCGNIREKTGAVLATPAVGSANRRLRPHFYTYKNVYYLYVLHSPSIQISRSCPSVHHRTPLLEMFPTSLLIKMTHEPYVPCCEQVSLFLA